MSFFGVKISGMKECLQPLIVMAKFPASGRGKFDFFLPWAGLEKSQVKGEILADIRAAERLGRLYDIRSARVIPLTHQTHGMP